MQCCVGGGGLGATCAGSPIVICDLARNAEELATRRGSCRLLGCAQIRVWVIVQMSKASSLDAEFRRRRAENHGAAIWRWTAIGFGGRRLGHFGKEKRDWRPGGKLPGRMWELPADLVKIFHAGFFSFSVWW